MEADLAHSIKSKVEAAFAQSDLLERRRDLMEQLARYVNGERGVKQDFLKIVIHRLFRPFWKPCNENGNTVKKYVTK